MLSVDEYARYFDRDWHVREAEEIELGIVRLVLAPTWPARWSLDREESARVVVMSGLDLYSIQRRAPGEFVVHSGLDPRTRGFRVPLSGRAAAALDVAVQQARRDHESVQRIWRVPLTKRSRYASLTIMEWGERRRGCEVRRGVVAILDGALHWYEYDLYDDRYTPYGFLRALPEAFPGLDFERCVNCELFFWTRGADYEFKGRTACGLCLHESRLPSRDVPANERREDRPPLFSAEEVCPLYERASGDGVFVGRIDDARIIVGLDPSPHYDDPEFLPTRPERWDPIWFQ